MMTQGMTTLMTHKLVNDSGTLAENQLELEKLQGPTVIFEAEDEGLYPKALEVRLP